MKAERGVVRFERGSRFRGKIDNRQDCLSATVAPTPSSATLILSASSLVTRPLTIAFDEVFGFLEAKRGDVPNHLDGLGGQRRERQRTHCALRRAAMWPKPIGRTDRKPTRQAQTGRWPSGERAAASVGADDPARGLLLKQRLKRNFEHGPGIPAVLDGLRKAGLPEE
jgi:hypothetical protein